MSLLTVDEVRRNLREMSAVLPEEHVEEIEAMLREKEEEQYVRLLEEMSDVIADGSD
tara:strand:+ start:701 stop:871 length:171 start_codon:yes stop_codon:yes gene_type:complete